MPVVQKGRGATNYAQRGMGVKLKEGGDSGSSIQLITLNATTNGEWTASPGQAYKTVIVRVPSGVTKVVTTITGSSGRLTSGYTTPLNAFDNSIPTKLTILVADGDIVDQSEVGSTYSFDNDVFFLNSTSIFLKGDSEFGVEVTFNPISGYANVMAYDTAEGYSPDYSSFSFSIIQYVFN